MNYLLIHNDNIPSTFVDNANHKIKISLNSEAIDRDIHRQLENVLNDKPFDIIVLPYTLSNDSYLIFSGIRTALHIRLTPEFKHSHAQIIFLGNEEAQEIARLSEFGSFLSTPGVFSIKIADVSTLDRSLSMINAAWVDYNTDSVRINESQYRHFVNQTIVEPPSDFDIKHNLDNEIAILEWARKTSCLDKIELKNDTHLTSLYIKYSIASNIIGVDEDDGKYNQISRNGKILLIDDDSDKGWKEIIHALDVKNNLEIVSLSSSQNWLLDVSKYLKEHDPDVVLLDLHLNREVELSNFCSLSSNIYREIKKFNKGISVLGFSASANVQLIIDSVVQFDGYVAKRSNLKTSDTINDLVIIVNRHLKQSRVLKDFYKKTSELVELSKTIDADFSEIVRLDVSIAFELLTLYYLSAPKKGIKGNNSSSKGRDKKGRDKYKSFAFHQLFLLVEKFVSRSDVYHGTKYIDNYIYGNGQSVMVLKRKNPIESNGRFKTFMRYNERRKVYDVTNDSSNKYDRDVDTNFKIGALLLYRYNVDPYKNQQSFEIEEVWRDWIDSNSVRNNMVAHYKDSANKVVNNDLYTLIEFLSFIFDRNNINVRASGLR